MLGVQERLRVLVALPLLPFQRVVAHPQMIKLLLLLAEAELDLLAGDDATIP